MDIFKTYGTQKNGCPIWTAVVNVSVLTFAGVNKRAEEDRKSVNAQVQYRIEMVCYRDNLDLEKQEERLAAQAKAFAEDPDLYKRYRAENSVRIGKSTLTD